jgi:hypothetical protein
LTGICAKMIADGSSMATVGLSKEVLKVGLFGKPYPRSGKALEPIYRRALAGESTVEELPLRDRVF